MTRKINERSIADQIVDGACCALCCCPYIEEHGYPAVCNDCWKDLDKEEKKLHQRATIKKAGD